MDPAKAKPTSDNKPQVPAIPPSEAKQTSDDKPSLLAKPTSDDKPPLPAIPPSEAKPTSEDKPPLPAIPPSEAKPISEDKPPLPAIPPSEAKPTSNEIKVMPVEPPVDTNDSPIAKPASNEKLTDTQPKRKHIAMAITRMPIGFKVPAHLDFTAKFSGSVNSAQKAVESVAIEVPTDGIYVQSARLTRLEGREVYFHLVPAGVRKTPERQMAIANGPQTTKTSRLYAMKITRQDDNFLMTDKLKMYDMTAKFGGSVRSAQKAIETGVEICGKEGIYVKSRRLTASEGNHKHC